MNRKPVYANIDSSNGELKIKSKSDFFIDDEGSLFVTGISAHRFLIDSEGELLFKPFK